MLHYYYYYCNYYLCTLHFSSVRPLSKAEIHINALYYKSSVGAGKKSHFPYLLIANMPANREVASAPLNYTARRQHSRTSPPAINQRLTPITLAVYFINSKLILTEHYPEN